ncbi:hypothetical protein A3F00_01130 [Candidatus Daviesbacteria bacterium RIFCSPHIGHO2_12_FULL_37_11]|uniref:Uncharacterized protein n=1 Tax=Candidatus Daviesbacteria bacterium RIFCSPHIGHO2_12_FULL_37_11 TaxID=1797777 RepID=A0A1F5KDQ7_9BACT|nr:MAG: hypothetical protein A2111_02500 [Candidatus Daviesbacteria bacterium GWA1_38_6]OGE39077.1 MAG: hypothetical protein A3F00_01130 [Candidatus Daviesbacteria bacterium RIFCSPHIGHO2_12_FULL_37_11]OGE44792.1 MAG: hypothetical protein A3B39_03205 [Candidatus Daviesbacteria bacterium RIFCSPLOWO2_01_FULL_37_10]
MLELEKILLRSKEAPSDISEASKLISTTLRENSQNIRTLHAYHQFQEMGVHDSEIVDSAREVPELSKNQLSSRWSSLCTANVADWLNHRPEMIIDWYHSRLNMDRYQNPMHIRAFTFLVNHPKALFIVLLLDPTISSAAFDNLSKETKQEFMKDFVANFGSPRLTPEKSIVDKVYSVAVQDVLRGNYEIDTIVQAEPVFPPDWYSLLYLTNRDFRSPHSSLAKISQYGF